MNRREHPRRSRVWAAIVAGLLLLVSGAVNVALVKALRFSYARELAVRRQPMSSRVPTRSGNIAGVRVLFLGDSRMAEWPFLPTNYCTINAGVTAETTAQVLLRTRAVLESEKPDIVVIQAGINDLKAIGVSPADAAEIKSNCVQNLSEIIALARQHQAKVIFTLILPGGSIPIVRQLFWSEDVNQAVGEVNGQLSLQFGNQPGIILLDPGKVLMDESSGASLADNYRDALHLTPAAYGKLQPALLSAIEKSRGPTNGPGKHP